MNRQTKSLALTLLVFSLLSVVGSESVAVGDLLPAPNSGRLKGDILL
jgi:hypothetical protein